MGSFSWLRADRRVEGKRSNLTEGDAYKILIPKEFGGGFIKDHYYDYGYVFHDTGHEADLYGILAYWNADMVSPYNKNKKVKDELSYYGWEFPSTMDEILKRGRTCLQNNRCLGIDIGCYMAQIVKLKYPLKLVSVRYKGTYEECENFSISDPEQGSHKARWNSAQVKNEYMVKCRKED